MIVLAEKTARAGAYGDHDGNRVSRGCQWDGFSWGWVFGAVLAEAQTILAGSRMGDTVLIRQDRLTLVQPSSMPVLPHRSTRCRTDPGSRRAGAQEGS